ncbi:MAG: DUF177 domain-containing protein [Oscillospiraceae bacterium]|nr:DUF177 domain-containing protein [Oscillospiraceae bacterium]
MKLNLREIIDMPGSGMHFECRLGTDRLDFPSIDRFVSPPAAAGEIKNKAGMLTLKAWLSARMICVCDRCGRKFDNAAEIDIDAAVSAERRENDDPDIYSLDGDFLDIDSVLETAFILNYDAKCLCREDCAGLCGGCGVDLNTGSCECKVIPDPRFAVLARLSETGEIPE